MLLRWTRAFTYMSLTNREHERRRSGNGELQSETRGRFPIGLHEHPRERAQPGLVRLCRYRNSFYSSNDIGYRSEERSCIYLRATRKIDQTETVHEVSANSWDSSEVRISASVPQNSSMSFVYYKFRTLSNSDSSSILI